MPVSVCSDTDLHEYMETLLAPGKDAHLSLKPSSPTLATKRNHSTGFELAVDLPARPFDDGDADQHIADLLDDLSLSSGTALELSQRSNDINNSLRPQSASPIQTQHTLAKPPQATGLPQSPANIIEADDFFAALSSDLAVSSIPSHEPPSQGAISEAAYTIPMSDRLASVGESDGLALHRDTPQVATGQQSPSPSSLPLPAAPHSPFAEEEPHQPSSDGSVSALTGFRAGSSMVETSHNSSHSPTDASFPTYASASGHSHSEQVGSQPTSTRASHSLHSRGPAPRRPYPTARMAYKTAASCIAHTVVPPEALNGKSPLPATVLLSHQHGVVACSPHKLHPRHDGPSPAPSTAAQLCSER